MAFNRLYQMMWERYKRKLEREREWVPDNQRQSQTVTPSLNGSRIHAIISDRVQCYRKEDVGVTLFCILCALHNSWYVMLFDWYYSRVWTANRLETSLSRALATDKYIGNNCFERMRQYLYYKSVAVAESQHSRRRALVSIFLSLTLNSCNNSIQWLYF